MRGRTKLLVVILILLLISAIGIVWYSQTRTASNTHANVEPTVNPPYQPGQTLNFLSAPGWNTGSTNALVSSQGLTLTTPTGVNWYYESNDTTGVSVTKSFTIDYQASAHGVSDAAKQETANLHLLSNRNIATSDNLPPNRFIISIDNNNNLVVYAVVFSTSSNFPQIPIVNTQDNIKAPSSGHLLITVSGIDTNDESFEIQNGDTKSRIIADKLPSQIFSTNNLYLEVSVQNSTQDNQGATMTVTSLNVTTQ